MATKKNKLKQFLWITVLILLAVVAYFGSMIYKKIYSPNVMTSKQSPQFILIPTGSVFEDVVKILDREHLLINEKSFRCNPAKSNA